MQAKVKLWQENFVALALAAGHQAPSAGLFTNASRGVMKSASLPQSLAASPRKIGLSTMPFIESMPAV
jgi:hypothetical protein